MGYVRLQKINYNKAVHAIKEEIILSIRDAKKHNALVFSGLDHQRIKFENGQSEKITPNTAKAVCSTFPGMYRIVKPEEIIIKNKNKPEKVNKIIDTENIDNNEVEVITSQPGSITKKVVKRRGKKSNK